MLVRQQENNSKTVSYLSAKTSLATSKYLIATYKEKNLKSDFRKSSDNIKQTFRQDIWSANFADFHFI